MAHNLLCTKLLQSKVSCHQTISCSLPSLCSWVDNTCARAWLETVSLNSATILRGVAHKWHILCEALDAGSHSAHPLRCAGASTTAVIPCVAVAWRARWGIVIHCNTYRLFAEKR